MFFVHPQIQFNTKEILGAFSNFFKKPDLERIKKELSSAFPGREFLFTDMARSAFKTIIEELHLQGSRVIFPAYICDIFYPIIKKYKIQPIFLDIDLETFHLKLNEIERVNSNPRAILLSHTYGLPIDKDSIKDLKEKKNISVIEDCAHTFGAQYKDDTYVGTAGDVSFFSLYKQFPMFRGGLLVYPEIWEPGKLKETYFNFRDFISFLNCFPVFSFLFKTFGNQVAPKFVRKEKMPCPADLNPVSLNFFSQYAKDYDVTLIRRKKLGQFFQRELEGLGFKVQKGENNIFCYLSALVPQGLESKRDELVEKLRKERVFCTRIWHTPIVLNSQVQEEYHLDLNDFPNTVEAANRVINFPLQNFYKEKDIKKIVRAIKKTLPQLKC